MNYYRIEYKRITHTAKLEKMIRENYDKDKIEKQKKLVDKYIKLKKLALQTENA